MQRLHEDDLLGHLLQKGGWEIISLPAIAEEDEIHEVRTPLGMQTWRSREGEALHPERESLVRIAELGADMSSYDFAAQYQQRPAPAGGGDIKEVWFPRYDPQNPPKFVRTIQAWDRRPTKGSATTFPSA